MIVLRDGGAEEGHDGVADEFIERAAVGEDRLHGAGEEVREELRHFFGGLRFRNGGEAADVGEENRHIGGADLRLVGGDDALHDLVDDGG